MKTLAFFFGLALAAVSAADPVALPALAVNGRSYRNATVTKTDAVFARIAHSDGVARVPMAALPEELRKRLGFDATAAKVATENAKVRQKAALRAAEKARKIAALPVRRFWVSENTREGLVVGDFTTRQIVSGGGARIGNGHTNSGGITERSYNFVFLSHTKETRSLPVDSEFSARVIENGTQRLDQETVVKRYKVAAIQKSAQSGVTPKEDP